MHPGYQRNADPFEGSPLYHPIFSEPDPFQLPRFADGRLADFGRASQWLIRSVSRKAAPLTSPPSHAAWTKAHRRHEKQHQHKQSQHNDNQPSAPAATHVRAFVHSSQWGSLAFDTPVASHLNYVNSFPPVSALLQSSQAHLSVPYDTATLHIAKDLEQLRVSLVQQLQASKQCRLAVVLQGSVDISALHDAQPSPCAALLMDCSGSGNGFLSLSQQSQDGTVDAWLRGITTLGPLQVGVDTHMDHTGAMTDFNARVVYAGTRRNISTGQPESFQVGLSSYHFGRAAQLSLYHHTAVRVNALPCCYWRNTSYGLLLTYTSWHERPWSVQAASSWQLDGTTLVQGMVSHDGTLDLSLKTRPYHFSDHSFRYLPDVTLDCGLSANLLSSSISFSASVHVGSWRQWSKDHPWSHSV